MNLLNAALWLLSDIKPGSFSAKSCFRSRNSARVWIQIQMLANPQTGSPMLHKTQLLPSSMQNCPGLFLLGFTDESWAAVPVMKSGEIPAWASQSGLEWEKYMGLFQKSNPMSCPVGPCAPLCPRTSQDPAAGGLADIPRMETGSVSQPVWYVSGWI